MARANARLCTLCISLSSLLLSDPLLENEQRLRQKDIFENLNKNPLDHTEHLEIKREDLIPAQTSNETCFNISSIDISGVTLIGKDTLNGALSKYLNRCDSLNDIKNLTDELSAIYMGKGYITSKVYLSPQNIANGSVELMALEGKVDDILPHDIDILAAFIGQKDNYLNIRDIEASLETLNRLSSNHASMKLVPSEKMGYTDIIVENSPSRRVGGSVSFDNYGGRHTGRIQGSGRFELEDVVGINDRLAIFFNSSDKHSTDEDSIGNGYEYSFALGRTSFTLSGRESRFDQKVKSGADIFYSRGRTKSYSFDTNYRFYHDTSSRFNLGFSLSNHQTQNYFAEIYMESSSYRLSKFGLSADYLYQMPGFYSFINFSYNKGIDLLNNHHHTDLDDKYEFYNISLSAMKDFFIFRYSLNAYSQLTKDSLFGSDRMSIGGVYSVRGFQEEGLSGNSGYYVRNELSYNLNQDMFSNSIFLAIDGGAIKSDKDSFGGRLLGGSLGTKLQTQNLEASIHYSVPIYKEDVQKVSNFFGVSFKGRF